MRAIFWKHLEEDTDEIQRFMCDKKLAKPSIRLEIGGESGGGGGGCNPSPGCVTYYRIK